MIALLSCIAVMVLSYVFIPFRLFVLHPVKSVYNAARDLYFYFRHKEYNEYKAGVLNCYFAHFGGGKTLTSVHLVVALFRRYNNRPVWDKGRRKFVLQKVHVISNVHLSSIPYEELCSLSQVVCCAWKNKQIDEKENTRTVVLVLLDEASSQLNSRSFKTNISPDFLNTLITSRHFHMSLYYTSQKFHLVDALLRSVTQRCIWCHKVWRFMVIYIYDSDEMEYASNPLLVKPLARTGFFVTDKDYNNYDTLATVEQLQKSVDKGDMLSEAEIIALRARNNPDNDSLSNPSRKLKRLRKREK